MAHNPVCQKLGVAPVAPQVPDLGVPGEGAMDAAVGDVSLYPPSAAEASAWKACPAGSSSGPLVWFWQGYEASGFLVMPKILK